MKKYVLLAQFLWLFGLTLTTQTGCSGGEAGEAHAAIDWRLYDLDDVNASFPINCVDVGAAKVVITLTNATTKETFTDFFACDDRYWNGVTAGVPAGYYTAQLELHAAAPAYPGASTLLDGFTMPITDAYLLEPGTSSLEPISFFVNRFAPSWRIYRGGVEVTCAQAGAAHVEIDIYYPGQSQAVTYPFSCTDPQPASWGIPMGSYVVGWQAILLDRAYQELALTDPANFAVQNDRMAILPSVAFAVR